jgi:DNA phosphorothioation-associated putative methyltransferase
MGDERARPGKIVGGALYLHRSALSTLEEAVRVQVDAVAARCERSWNVAKIDLKGPGISLLDYEPFETAPFPALRGSFRISDSGAEPAARVYGYGNPPILHRKELLLPFDHPDRPSFVALTEALERAGLFTEMTKRGRRLAWEGALLEAGVRVIGHALAPMAPEPVAQVLRHRTAIGREGLSAPIAALHAVGLLNDAQVLDYGCGRGDDVRSLQAAGIDAVGWDPHFAPDPDLRQHRPLVNLGFVLNVIEDEEERRAALRSAWSLCGRCLSVAVMLVGKGDVSGHRPYRDGYLTSRGTFQKYYTQTELRAFIADTLDRTPVAAGPGVFFVFRDEALEQRHLSRRRAGFGGLIRIPAAPRPPRAFTPTGGARAAALDEVRDDLAAILLELGRAPHSSELPFELVERLRRGRVSHAHAIADALSAVSSGSVDEAAARRRAEVTRFFAMQRFEGRRAYTKLDPSLQRDVKAFLGSIGSAAAAGEALLFSAGDVAALANEAQTLVQSGLGRMAGGKFTLHVRDIARLTPRLRMYLSIAESVAGALEDVILLRVHIRSRRLSALSYPEFDKQALPRLSRRTKIDLKTGEVEVFDHVGDGQVSVLIGKSSFMDNSDVRLADQRTFDEQVFALFGGRDVERVGFARLARTLLTAGIRLPY